MAKSKDKIPNYITGIYGRRRVHSLLAAVRAGVQVEVEETGVPVTYAPRDTNDYNQTRYCWKDAAGNRYESFDCSAVTDN